MKKIILGKSNMEIPAIGIGCMRINDLEINNLTSYINYCIENGLNFFDHADIYGKGVCEINFSKAFKNTGYKREDIILQSKCGIVPGKMYNFSKEYIIKSVEGILKRLDTDYLDILTLHRPDALVEPEEVAEAFNELEKSGKVKFFSVSNHRPYQIELLKKYIKQDIVANQLQFGIAFSNMIAAGMETNMVTEGSIDRDGGVLDYCRLNDITIQSWSPFQFGFFEGLFLGNKEKYSELNKVLEELSQKYSVTPTAIATAWILRHPAKIQMLSGTTNISRLKEIISGSELYLEREEWYKLYLSSGHILP